MAEAGGKNAVSGVRQTGVLFLALLPPAAWPQASYLSPATSSVNQGLMVARSCDENPANICKRTQSKYSLNGAGMTSSTILLFIYKLLLLLLIVDNLPQFKRKKF